MEFRLLGVLEVVEGEQDHTVGIGRGRERALLALFLISGNRPVTPDQIVEALWAAGPPATAAKTVQIYVSHLRKALGADRIETTPAGYRLRLEANELDSDRFEELAREGRAVLDHGEATEAQRLLESALALWRGEALADFRYESFAQDEVRRLSDLRDTTRSDLVDARLAAGRADDLIPGLEAEIAASPLRERPRAQLMLALYRAGRQAEALAVYQETRVLLDEELGIVPGPELEELQRRLLNHDPTLRAKPAPAALRRRRRRALLLALAGGALIAIAAGAAGVELSRRDGRSAAVIPPADSLVALNARTGHVAAVVPVPGGPSQVAAGRNVVWVSSDIARTLTEVSTTTGRPLEVVTPGFAASGLVLGTSGTVWALDAPRHTLVEVAPRFNGVIRRVALSKSSTADPQPAIAGGGATIWAADGGTLFRIDTATGAKKVVADIGQPLDALAVGLGSVWAVSGPASTLYRIDPSSGLITQRIGIAAARGDTAPFPLGVAAGEGAVWVLSGNTSTVSRVDPVLGAVTSTILLGAESEARDIAAGPDGVWVSEGGSGSAVRIDPGANRVTTELGSFPAGIATSAGRTWVALQPGFSVSTAGLASSRAQLAGGGSALPGTFCSPVYATAGQAPRYLVVADLPLQAFGDSEQTLQMSDAVRFIVAQHGFRAGRFPIGLQICDDSSASTGSWTPQVCARNAHALARNPRVLGVIGPFNSGCAKAEIPILNAAPHGPVAEIGPSTTYVGITHRGPGTAADEPAVYYPTGTRSFARVVAPDDVQGKADAELAQRVGVHRLFVLRDDEPYGIGIASDVSTAAETLGINVVGHASWVDGSPYRLARRIKLARADGVFIGGTFDEGQGGGGAFIRALRQVLGKKLRILTPDGFTPASVVARDGGRAAEGVFVSVAAPLAQRLPPAGQTFIRAFGRALSAPIEPYTLTAAQAADVLLGAIARSNGTRSSVTSNVMHAHVTNGLLGSFSFDRNGDTTAGSVTIYRIVNGRPTTYGVITPRPVRAGK